MKRAFIVASLLIGLLYPAAAFWQSRDSNYNVASGAPPPSFSLTYESSASSSATTSTIDYGTLSYGSGNTRVILAIANRVDLGVTVTSASIGGTSLSHISGAYESGGGVDMVDMWISTAPLAGSSGDVQVTYSGTVFGPSSAVALYNLVTTTPAPSATNIGSTPNGASAGAAISIPTGGGGAVVANCENGSIISGTNFTIDANLNSGRQVFGHTTSTGSVTPTVNSSSTDAMVISATSWAP